jgi:hypothetical protein
MMAKDNDDTKPTVEDVDRVILEHERIKVAGQDMKQAIKERIAKGHGPSEDVRLKQGESLWDRADRAIGTAEKVDTAEKASGKGGAKD